MTEEQYKEIRRIKSELSEMEDMVKALNGCSPSSGLTLVGKTGYSDMGHDIERTIKMKGDVALECWSAIRDIITNRIQENKKRFDEIKVEGV